MPDPTILRSTDIIVRVTSSGICGSDLHLYDVLSPFLDKGDILGHEPRGVVEEVGSEVTAMLPDGLAAKLMEHVPTQTSGAAKVLVKPWG